MPVNDGSSNGSTSTSSSGSDSISVNCTRTLRGHPEDSEVLSDSDSISLASSGSLLGCFADTGGDGPTDDEPTDLNELAAGLT